MPPRVALTDSVVCALETLVNRDVEESVRDSVRNVEASVRITVELPVFAGIGEIAGIRLASMLCRVSWLTSLPNGLTVCRVSRLVPVPAVPGRGASALLWGAVLAEGVA